MATPVPTSFDVFLSYHWRDHAHVEALATRLRGQNLTVFLDRWYLTPGQSWPKALETTLANCRAVAVCIGQGEMGPWQQREQYLALERQVAAERQRQTFPVIPILLSGAEPPLGFLSQLTWIDFRIRVDDPILLNTLVNAIHGKPPGPDAQETARQTLSTICPYRGLLYFREEDAPFFFGRAAAITQLTSAVQQHSLVVMVGASGSGKSSVVRAGLIPELRKSGDRVWEVATMVPTDRPVHALATALMPFLEPDMSEIDRVIETNKLAEVLLNRKASLRDFVDRVLAKQPGTDRLLLIADQWEELFTLCKDDGARRCFIDNILQATAITRLSVVLTLRGDFFGRAITDYRPLSDRMQGAQVNLGPMQRDELRQAIEEPAKKVGLAFEAGLVDLILEQAGQEPGHLPLLEFVLRQIWEQRRGGELHHDAYRAMGQLTGAIAAKADSVYEPLSPQDQRLVQRIFIRLVRPGEGEADTRRRATSSELGTEMQHLVKALTDARLLVTSRVTGSEEATLEVSHEALIRHWATLKSWVDADRQFMIWQQGLHATVKRWKESGQPAGLLLRELPLHDAEDWLIKQPDSFSPDERAFVTASQSRKRLEWMGVIIVTGLVLWFLGTTFWLWQKGYNLDQAGLKARSLVMNIHQEPEMVEIPQGSFLQGDVEKLGVASWNPVHPVTIKSFAMGKYEVTFAEYDRFAIATGRRLPEDQGWGRNHRPVINVSWDDAAAYAGWLSKQTGKRYRLPTESEWEYAARSGAKQDTWAGTSQEAEFGTYAIFSKNSENRTAIVGTKQRNEFRLHDLSGNVFEWVEDCVHGTYEGAPNDGTAWLDTNEGICTHRMHRGGSWDSTPEYLRASFRNRNGAATRNNYIGFRLAQDLEP